MSAKFLVNIVLPIPVERTFTYYVPNELQSAVGIGKRVFIPFGKKKMTGIITELPSSTTIKKIKPIIDVLDETPILTSEMLKLTKWIAEYYFAPLGEVMKIALPQGFISKSNRIIKLNCESIEPFLQDFKKSSHQYTILKKLNEHKSLSISQLQKNTNIKSIYATLHELQKKNLITIEEKIKPKLRPKLQKLLSITQQGADILNDPNNIKLAARHIEILKTLNQHISKSDNRIELHSFLKSNSLSLSSIKTLIKKGLVQIIEEEILRYTEYDQTENPIDIKLNSDQQRALNEIINAISNNKFNAFLLHGITGSGKTQVYIEAIRHLLSFGKTAIVLVPEISLTPQTVNRFKAHFGNEVTVIHSQMSGGERYDAWRMAKEGKVKIVIGPRSAIFAPLENLGLIVVDEEHESSYKQYDYTPRYNARDVALIRASQVNAVVILGSATPSIESYTNALNGKYTLLELPQRVDNAKLPTIEIVDMVNERREVINGLKDELEKSKERYPKHFRHYSVSRLLQSQILDRLQRKEGVILLQNRRGFSHIMECYDCGYVEKCDNCDVSLTYHLTKKHLRCHYCGFVKNPPSTCPSCSSLELRMHSFGTQQVHKELQEIFSEAKILRMDRDTTTRKGSHRNILKQFEKGDCDILLGTQMVAKGLDFARVTLVGVISADTQLTLPDFRASEITFQLLTQVAGRAGRSNLAGEVVIQTTQPNHYSIKHATTHNFRGFYDEELEHRRELDYPPFSRIVLVEFSGERENEVQHHANKFVEFLKMYRQKNNFIILGPADAAIPKIKNVYRKHILIKNLKSADPSGALLRASLLKVKTRYEASPLAKNKKIKMVIDVDPQGMM